MSQSEVLRAAIVGAGPSGFYTAEKLLAAGIEVDLLDTLPTPYGLVRAGVAPDHPKIKSVTRVFARTAARPGFRFFGNLTLGRDISRDDLLTHYDIVVYAIGTSDDNRLGIPGEDRPGSHPATQFVAWYNGHPDAADYHFNLTSSRAVVIGHGNVAIDVARMLVLHPEELAVTDTADHAIRQLAESSIEEVVLLGRRGPAQAAFTNPELAELGELMRAGVDVSAEELELDAHTSQWIEGEAGQTTKRNLEMLAAYAQRGPRQATHRVTLRFLRSPVEIVGDGDDGPVTGVRVTRNRLEVTADGRLRAVSTGEEQTISCGLVLRSIGYRGRPLSGIPFDTRRGVIRNVAGRVVSEDGGPHRGEYVVGWIKRGPSGVIGTNKRDATDTVSQILEDVARGVLNHPHHHEPESAQTMLRARAPRHVTWQGWEAIDASETVAGLPHGRPRRKLTRLADLVAAAEARQTEAQSSPDAR